MILVILKNNSNRDCDLLRDNGDVAIFQSMIEADEAGGEAIEGSGGRYNIYTTMPVLHYLNMMASKMGASPDNL